MALLLVEDRLIPVDAPNVRVELGCKVKSLPSS